VTVQTRSGHARGGRTIGGWIVGRRRAPAGEHCDCCSRCMIEPGDVVFDVMHRGRRTVVCADCVGEWQW
jgi:hypothetical protein